MAQSENRYSKEQKIGVILLSVFVLLVVTLGLIQMRNTLYKPFALNNSIPPLLGQEVNTPDALRFRDTDLDGLTDFDELYIYTTSPYLADTDSDGLTDKQEVEQGKNPNCAEGMACAAPETSAEALPVQTLATSSDYSGENAYNSVEEFLGDPEQLRQILLTTGVEQSVLDQISDEELVKIAAEIFSTEQWQGATSTTDEENAAVAQFINDLMSGKTN